MDDHEAENIPFLLKEQTVARDPVCGMEVKDFLYYARFKGILYLFCCSSCKQRFDESPWSYIASICEENLSVDMNIDPENLRAWTIEKQGENNDA